MANVPKIHGEHPSTSCMSKTHCHNLPLGGKARRDLRVCLPKGKTRGSHHQHLFEENVIKTKKGSANFKNKGSGVVYARGRY